VNDSAAEVALDGWRRNFAVARDHAYLDHATLGPLPQPSAEAIVASVAAQAAKGSLAFPALQATAEDVRGRFAKFIGAEPTEIAITSSTAMGINIVAKGLRWREGDSVVVPAIDFPANMYPWMHLASRGVEVRRVPAREDRVAADDLLAACDWRTRVVAVSIVQFSTGFRADIEALGEACRARGILLVVDGMQAIGWLNLDVHALPVDAMALQSYKWLLGPHGVGWLYVRRDMVEQIEPLAVGSRSMTARDSFLDHRFELSPTATRFETGVLNLHGLAGVGASLDLLGRVGTRAIEVRVLSLSDRLREGLAARGYAVAGSRRNARERSAIVVFWHPQVESGECHRRLADAAVVVSLREGAVRASPHFYNSEDDIDRLLDALP
jgi:selenocysteine lyase/cysteine desulfurase